MRIIKDIALFNDYLKDESQLVGHADSIYFCHTTKDVEEVLATCYKDDIPVTIQGALTGLCGGAVPQSGVVLNLSEMNQVLGMSYDKTSKKYALTLQAGLTLKELTHLLKTKKFNTSNFNKESWEAYQLFLSDVPLFFPNDPTETLASIGGMVSCDASGACSYHYGSIRKHVDAVTLVTASKRIYIKRGMYRYHDLPILLGKDMTVLPKWKIQDTRIKDVAGLYYDEEMDLLDLIIGSEGLFGVITEIEIALCEEAKIEAGLMLFLNENHQLVSFVDYIRNSDSPLFKNNILAIEYFDRNSLKLLNKFRELNSSIKKLPLISEEYAGSIYLEFHVDTESQLDELFGEIFDCLPNYGINEREQWLGVEASDFEKLKLFRHAVPECVNILIASKKQDDNRINKLGTDMSVPNSFLQDVLTMYQNDIDHSKISSVIFGHIGDNHLHVNLIPDTFEQFLVSKELIKKWAKFVTANAGSVSAEHGIGKLKKDLFNIMVNEEDILSMKELKKILEPKELINQGTLFD